MLDLFVMSGEHFSGGRMPHHPEKFLPDDVYNQVERNVVYGCVDVTYRNPQTGELLFGSRQVEPQVGAWFVGGRMEYGKGIKMSAAKQTENDLGLGIPPERFQHIATYDTDFPVAGPGREDHGRNTLNATMCVDLTPEEVAEVSANLAEGKVSKEYGSGAWYRPSEIVKTDTDFPWTLKQFVRDLHAHDLMGEALREEADREDRKRTVAKAENAEARQLIRGLVEMGLSGDDADRLVKRGGRNAQYAIGWARQGIDRLGSKKLDRQLSAWLESDSGDWQLKQELRRSGLVVPDVADNGPALRAILSGALETLKVDRERSGALLKSVEPIPADQSGDLPDYEL